jgi:hypothetical protein
MCSYCPGDKITVNFFQGTRERTASTSSADQVGISASGKANNVKVI